VRNWVDRACAACLSRGPGWSKADHRHSARGSQREARRMERQQLRAGARDSARPDTRQHLARLAYQRGHLLRAPLLRELRDRLLDAAHRPARRCEQFPRRDISPAAIVGRAGLFAALLLGRSRPRRTLRGFRAARPIRRGTARRIPGASSTLDGLRFPQAVERLLPTVDSTDRCNILVESFCRCFEVESFPRSLIEARSDRIQLGLRVRRKINSLGQVLAQ